MNAANFAGDRKLLWLASYPKSGNTWVRSLLSAYLLRDDEFSLNAMLGQQDPFDRQLLDDHAGINSADFQPEELLPYQAQFHRDLARQSADWRLIKTHSTFARGADRTALFPVSASAGAIVIVRNPLDIAPSYAHHEAKPVDWVIAHMRDKHATSDTWATHGGTMVPQRMSSWSENVRSWLNQTGIPVLLIRYEDLHSDTEVALSKMLRFCAVELDANRVSRSVERCRFERLRADEDRTGFSERPSVERTFFRSGKVGDGITMLSEEQIFAIVQDHKAAMKMIGYPADPQLYISSKQRDL